jgi:hypothetical protein
MEMRAEEIWRTAIRVLVTLRGSIVVERHFFLVVSVLGE